MAAADYRLCDVCGSKAFYDSNLSYENGPTEYGDYGPFRTEGEPQYDTPEKCHDWGTRLGYLGDWAVLCTHCAKSFRTQIVPIAPGPFAMATRVEPGEHGREVTVVTVTAADGSAVHEERMHDDFMKASKLATAKAIMERGGDARNPAGEQTKEKQG